MPEMATTDVNDTLRLLGEAGACRESKLKQFNAGDDAVSSDDENDSV